MSSTISNPSMLTASPSPSPSPEPQEHPLEGGNASVDDPTLDDAALKEPEESESNRVEHAWAAVLNTMRICVDTAPPSKPELLEEQESWLRDWNVAMADMTVVYKRAWKGKEVVATEEKAVEKAVGSGPTDMGRPCLGGRMTATSVNCPAERCQRCTASGAKCIVVHAGGHCKVCIKARKGCSFVVAKNKGCVLAAPKRKAPPSVQTTAPDAGESEVEIVGEATADEPVPAPSKEIIVQRPKHALDADAAPAAKRPRLEADPELEEAHAEAVWLRAENAELRTHNDKYRLALLDMGQHTRIQESELLHMSNRLYILAHDWGNWEKELGEVLED
ncbi:uncharacterized protein F5147DRAFT_768854 [Suillus discolor]|uniref:Uncharacterized protein n=1 Tax=Suillus discolor TaxID=1912936 RepID=A0A9P7JYN1_9AGAM|nr:uncharacterized protein F5147DRAFT_768854 [Suillus discolor]KAG2116483.1 hypothetical protein F5147DRAFT_768854 [Suillus discolor]